METEQLLDAVCECYGIALEYVDIWGRRHRVPVTVKQRLLQAMGVSTVDRTALQHALDEHRERAWRQLLPPVQVSRQPEALRICLTLPAAYSRVEFNWCLQFEDGSCWQGRWRACELQQLDEGWIGEECFIRYGFPLDNVPLGYHWFELNAVELPSGFNAKMSLIIAPQHCYRPSTLVHEKRVWGLALQLYGLRSLDNWGIGDFGDLMQVLGRCAELGADIVGVSPLHALFPHNPAKASPYNPSSRLLLNVLYLNVAAIPDFKQSPQAQQLVGDPVFQARLQALRAGEYVDYEAVAAAKFEVLEQLYQHFREHHLAQDSDYARAFSAFCTQQGETLARHAQFEALQEYFQHRDPTIWGWPVWPEPYRDPDSVEVAEFAVAQRERVEFYAYLQWQTARQLEAVGQRCAALGLAVGLYQDLALGVDGGGAEAWGRRGLYALDISIGAPPDDFSPKGQNWGLPPYIPDRLYQASYQPFIDLLQCSMQHAGAIRIDHVMGLMRLFWITGTAPDGSHQGSYVSYPLSDLLAILALESQRNQCLVIGEDLGTVPDSLRADLADLGVFSYRLLYFEKDSEGAFRPPSHYPEQALVAITTHDLPTLAGYWQGRDIQQRTELDLFPSSAVGEQQWNVRAQDRQRLLEALRQQSSSMPIVEDASTQTMNAELAQAIHLYLAQSPAKVMMVQPEDVCGQLDQVNLPGTIDQYPNWRRKLALALDDWSHDERLRALAQALRSAGRGSG